MTEPRDQGNWAKPVEQLSVGDVSADAGKGHVEGRKVVGPLQGFGQMWQKSYRVRIDDTTPEDIVATWKERYGDFWLTDAVRPSYDLEVVPEQGYRHDVYHDSEAQTKVPVVMAAASKDVVFELTPVSDTEAAAMLETIQGAPLLEGVRGQQEVDRFFAIFVPMAWGG